jgi:hypothetical protein
VVVKVAVHEAGALKSDVRGPQLYLLMLAALLMTSDVDVVEVMVMCCSMVL